MPSRPKPASWNLVLGSRAIDIDFPQARTTQWTPGSVVPVGFVAIYHGGGYNFRLCKVPSTGKKDLTEEC